MAENRTYLVTNIKYDTDGIEVELPSEMTIVIPEGIEEDEFLDYISDEISNRTGYCHFGFSTTPEIV